MKHVYPSRLLTPQRTLSLLWPKISPLMSTKIHAVGTREKYAVNLNPFYNYNHLSLASAQTELDLADGRIVLRNNPIWPLFHRTVDVTIVSDNSTQGTLAQKVVPHFSDNCQRVGCSTERCIILISTLKREELNSGTFTPSLLAKAEKARILSPG
jgi:hypothetical protein